MSRSPVSARNISCRSPASRCSPSSRRTRRPDCWSRTAPRCGCPGPSSTASASRTSRHPSRSSRTTTTPTPSRCSVGSASRTSWTRPDVAFGAFANTGPDLSAAAPRRRSYIALFLLLPGVVYLIATFVAPLVSLVLTSFKEPGGTFDVGEYVYAFNWQNYVEALSRFGEIFVRTFGYSATATILALLISYPLAYFIGVTLRRYPLWQSLTLILVIAPFFISFLLRTLALKAIFADEGPVVGVLQSLGILGPSDYLNGTAFTVILGLTYNYIPFMTLPIYASLERLDLRYVEAGGDLYAGPAQRLLRLLLPLPLPPLP